MEKLKLEKKSSKNSYILIGWLLVILQITSILGGNQIDESLKYKDYGSLAGYLSFGVLGLLFLIFGYKNKKLEKDIKNN